MNVLKFEVWFYGLLSAVIGGAASAGGAWMGMAAAKSAGVDVPALNFKALGIILVAAGLTNAFAYLSRSPLPAPATGNTAIVSKSDVTKTPINP